MAVVRGQGISAGSGTDYSLPRPIPVLQRNMAPDQQPGQTGIHRNLPGDRLEYG